MFNIYCIMSARRYFAWRLAVEAVEADRREDERRDFFLRRRKVSINRISDSQFLQRYKLTKSAFKFLCETLRVNTNLRSSKRVVLEAKVLSALEFFANGEHQRVVGLANHMSQEAISLYIKEVTRALNHPNIVKKFIKFPDTKEAIDEIQQNFFNIHGIPGVVGCVDCRHFRIFKPNNGADLYFCRKHYYSLNVQIVADHECRILSISPATPGATHDAVVWENSDINNCMQKLNQNGESVCLLADNAYPQRPWLMTPYNNPAPGSVEESYNAAHSKAWAFIDNTFAQLKNRWRCLCKERVLHYTPDKCVSIITACIVLHNIALDFGVPSPPQTIVKQEFRRVEILPQENEPQLTLGYEARDRLAAAIHSTTT